MSIIVSANSLSELTTALVASGALIATEGGLVAPPGGVYSYMGVHNGMACALVSGTKEVEDALASYTSTAGLPTRNILGAAAPERFVSPLAWRLALVEAGLYEAASELINQSDRSTQILYEFSSKVLRSHPLLASMAVALGKTEEDVEALFQRAEAIDRE